MINWSKALRFENMLREEKDAAKVRFVKWANGVTLEITGPVPYAEEQSWISKESEARSFLAGVIDAPHGLSLEAEIRGVTVDALAQRVVSKADAYRAVAAQLAGLRALFEQSIANATTAEEIDACFDQAVAMWHGAIRGT